MSEDGLYCFLQTIKMIDEINPRAFSNYQKFKGHLNPKQIFSIGLTPQIKRKLKNKSKNRLPKPK